MYNWISFRYMSFQGNSMPTAPTMQMRPRSRQRLKACCAGAGDFEAAEVIDLRSANPLNYDILADSVRKTGKALLVCEAVERGCVMQRSEERRVGEERRS